VLFHRLRLCPGATSTRDRSSRPSLSTYASSEFSDEDEDRELSEGLGDGDDDKSTSSSGTWVTDNGTSEEEAAAADEEKHVEGHVSEASSDEELDKKVACRLSLTPAEYRTTVCVGMVAGGNVDSWNVSNLHEVHGVRALCGALVLLQVLLHFR
jgi:hypothetical protein